MGGLGKIGWRAAAGEAAAVGTAILSMPLRWILPAERVDSVASAGTPVVFVHGLFGDPTNFLVLRNRLATRAVRNFASFSYLPRLDYQRLAVELGHFIERVRAATGARQVDVVGHSLGGLAGRYFMAIDEADSVRHLVTLGAPYYAGRLSDRELAIFGADDPLVVPPAPAYGPHGRIKVVHDCGHLALLYHPDVIGEVVAHLTTRPDTTARRERPDHPGSALRRHPNRVRSSRFPRGHDSYRSTCSERWA